MYKSLTLFPVLCPRWGVLTRLFTGLADAQPALGLGLAQWKVRSQRWSLMLGHASLGAGSWDTVQHTAQVLDRFRSLMLGAAHRGWEQHVEEQARMFLSPRGAGSLVHQGYMDGASPARPSGVIWQCTLDPRRERAARQW